MAQKSNQTASFVVRFTQKIYNDDKGDTAVQWRGKVTHVQGDDYVNFTDFSDAMTFIKDKLDDQTKELAGDKTKEEQEGILRKSFVLWRKVATAGPQLVVEAIRDPKKSVAQIQGQIKDQIKEAGDEFSQKLELDTWRTASKSDYHNMMKLLRELTKDVARLNEKVDQLSA